MESTDEMRQEIATRLRAAREQAGLSQGQVAKMLDLHRPAISEIEAGRRRVSAEELTRLAEYFRVSVNWITGKGDQGADPTVELAARELTQLKKVDLDRVLNLLRTLRRAK